MQELTIEKTDGSPYDLKVSAEESDIVAFLENDMANNIDMQRFMEWVFSDQCRVDLLSNHRDFFKVPKFEQRALIVDTDVRNNEYENLQRSIEFVKRFYTPIIKQSTSQLRKIEDLIKIATALIYKTVSSLPDEAIERIRKASLEDVYKIAKENSEDIKIDIDEVMKLIKEIKNENSDIYLLLNALPLTLAESIENMKSFPMMPKCANFRDTEMIFPMLTIYICISDNHNMSNPPFISVIPPHMDSLTAPVTCPICNRELKRIQFLTFSPLISKRIMNEGKEGGFLPYMLAYLLNENAFNFVPNITITNNEIGKSKEIDFIVKKENKIFFLETKVFRKHEKTNTSIRENINKAMRQITGFSELARTVINTENSKYIIIVNYDRKTMAENGIEKEIDNVRIFGCDELYSLIDFIKNS